MCAPLRISDLSNITDPSGSTAWLYDAHSRVTQKTQIVGAKTFMIKGVVFALFFTRLISTITRPQEINGVNPRKAH